MFYIYNGKVYYKEGDSFYDTEIVDAELRILNKTKDTVESTRLATYDTIKRMFALDRIVGRKKRGRVKSDETTSLDAEV